MKFNKENIAKLTKGKVAIKNDGTLDELQDVMSEAGDEDAYYWSGGFRFYWYNNGECCFDHTTNLPYLSVSEFLET